MPDSRTVLVTGAFGALGGAVARKFLAEGARLGLIGRGAVPAELTRAFPAPHVLEGGIDLSDPAATAAAVKRIAGAPGTLDVLVNVAGGFRFQSLAEGDVDTWQLMFDMNLKTAVVASRAVLPYLFSRGAGRIINIGAGAAARGHAGMGPYSASKAGVERLSESLSDELKDRNITVNTVLPGTMDTAANRAEMPAADITRWVAPEAVADVVAFLASDAARAVTGAAIRVFGRG
jgi:NAD(P)-dependent dehydrogenase (short-subunit alcohol dehydrogenase family)